PILLKKEIDGSIFTLREAGGSLKAAFLLSDKEKIVYISSPPYLVKNEISNSSSVDRSMASSMDTDVPMVSSVKRKEPSSSSRRSRCPKRKACSRIRSGTLLLCGMGLEVDKLCYLQENLIHGFSV
ncbi:hypothetical protein Tco_1000503, partial [Tanacetum coccineum]